MLKGDFHIHVNEDPYDGLTGTRQARHSTRDLIDKAARLEYDVLAITCHDYVVDDPGLDRYARDRGILLIPSAELTLENGKHVLALNTNNEDIKRVKTIDDLAYLKKNGAVIIAPHPFGITKECLNDHLRQNVKYFDAIELGYFSARFYFLDMNTKAKRFAEETGLPLLANTDTHKLYQFGRQYSLIDAQQTKGSVLEAIRKGKVTPMDADLSVLELISGITGMQMTKLMSFMMRPL